MMSLRWHFLERILRTLLDQFVIKCCLPHISNVSTIYQSSFCFYCVIKINVILIYRSVKANLNFSVIKLTTNLPKVVRANFENGNQIMQSLKKSRKFSNKRGKAENFYLFYKPIINVLFFCKIWRNLNQIREIIGFASDLPRDCVFRVDWLNQTRKL